MRGGRGGGGRCACRSSGSLPRRLPALRPNRGVVPGVHLGEMHEVLGEPGGEVALQGGWVRRGTVRANPRPCEEDGIAGAMGRESMFKIVKGRESRGLLI